MTMPLGRAARIALLITATLGVALGVGEVAVARARQPAPSARGGGELWLEPATIYGDAVWFADELVPIEEAVAAALARPELGGYVVRPVSEMRAFWRDVQAGHLPGVAAVCGAPPSPARLARLVHRAASIADLRADCPAAKGAGDAPAACVFEVTVSTPRPAKGDPDRLVETARFRALLPPGESPVRWAERLRAGALKKERGAAPAVGGLGIASAGSSTDEHGAVHLNLDEVTLSGTWSKPLTLFPFAAQKAALAACMRPARPFRDDWVQPYVIEVDAAGGAVRCEVQHIAHLPRPEQACVCGALRGASFGAGAPGRRATFVLSIVPPADAAAGDGLQRSLVPEELTASDPSAVLGSDAIDEPALEACLLPVKTEIEVNVRARFTVAADGRPTHHEAKWPRVLSADVRRCLEGVLDRASFNCPLTGAADVSARLRLAIGR